MKVLAIEPYYGGSHRAFLDGWIARSRHDWTLLTLPASKWKWRMRHGAMTFGDEIEARPDEGWNLLFCSDMLNMAELVGLAPDRLGRLAKLAYFHENQLTYPVQVEREWDLHFALINLSTIRAADAIWFNSEFHRSELLGAISGLFRKMPGRGAELDRALQARLRERSSVQSPPFDLPQVTVERSSGPLEIAWAARWEFDKNPDLLFAALFDLERRGVDFRVHVLGERFQREPPIFAAARSRLADRIGAWGYQPTREAYATALGRAHVFVSTADHEFFGLAAVEAIATGAWPLLPDRLSYPELLGEAPSRERYLYEGTAESLADRLETAADHLAASGTLVDDALETLRASMIRYSWRGAIDDLDDGLERVISRSTRPD